MCVNIICTSRERDLKLAPPIPPALPTTWSGIIVFVAGLMFLWVSVSTPVYFAGKFVKGTLASFSDAMGATLGGTIVYFLIFYIVAMSLNTFLGIAATILGIDLAIITWLIVYRRAFNTSWLGALGIVISSWLLLYILDLFLVQIFGVSFPNFIPF
jgi:hypothetical protein